MPKTEVYPRLQFKNKTKGLPSGQRASAQSRHPDWNQWPVIQAQKKRGKSFWDWHSVNGLEVDTSILGELEDMHREKNRFYMFLYNIFFSIPFYLLFGNVLCLISWPKSARQIIQWPFHRLCSVQTLDCSYPLERHRNIRNPGRRNMATVPTKNGSPANVQIWTFPIIQFSIFPLLFFPDNTADLGCVVLTTPCWVIIQSSSYSINPLSTPIMAHNISTRGFEHCSRGKNNA